MPKIDSTTKEKILVAAEKVFHSNGFKGARTTLIAQEAGISRTMLHYYYNTKEELFQAILHRTFGTALTHIRHILDANRSLDELVEHLIDVISDLLEEQPGLPSFIVNILNESPDIAVFLAATQPDGVPYELDVLLKNAREKGEIVEDITGEDLIMNIYALCSLPYLTAPYVKAKENRTDENMTVFIRERRERVKKFVLRGIKS